MRVLFLQFPLFPAWGGAEAHTLSLLRGLKARDVEVFAVSSNPSLVAALKKHHIPARLIWCGWEPTSLPALLLFPLTLIIAIPIFFFLILRCRPQTVACLSLADKLIATPLAKFLGTRVVWLEHTRIGNWLKLSPLRPFYVLASSWASLICPSYFLRNQIIGLGVGIKNISVVYPGTFLSSPTSRKGNFEGMKIITLGFLGRLAREKGVLLLPEILVGLPENFYLRVAGNGPQLADLKNLASKLGLGNRIKFLGFQENPENFLNGLDALAVPSIRTEAFGLVIIEAMAAGVPVVAAKTGAIPEILEHEKTGLLCEPGNPEAFQKSIKWLFADELRRERLIAAARKSVELRFGAARMLNSLETVLSKNLT